MIDESRWRGITFYEQFGNISSELSRAIIFKGQHDEARMNASLLRLIELLDLTKADPKNRARLRELCRFKEVIGDWYCQTHVYDVEPESLKNFSLNVAMLARR